MLCRKRARQSQATEKKSKRHSPPVQPLDSRRSASNERLPSPDKYGLDALIERAEGLSVNRGFRRRWKPRRESGVYTWERQLCSPSKRRHPRSPSGFRSPCPGGRVANPSTAECLDGPASFPHSTQVPHEFEWYFGHTTCSLHSLRRSAQISHLNRTHLGDNSVIRRGYVKWPLLLATIVAVVAWMVALDAGDWGHDVALRVFVWPIEGVLRRVW